MRGVRVLGVGADHDRTVLPCRQGGERSGATASVSVREYALGLGLGAHTEIVNAQPVIADLLQWISEGDLAPPEGS